MADLLNRAGLGEKYFRNRGTQMTRIEGFTDACFAFAITLLIVSSNIPKSYAELMGALNGFPAFAICFLVLCRIWYSHYQYCRRYGLETPKLIALNLVLVFMVLFFVFPLKYLISVATTVMIAVATHSFDEMTRTQTGTLQELVTLLRIFCLGFASINVVLALMYQYAYTEAETLELSPLEAFLTRTKVWEAIGIGAALLFAAISLALPGLAGIAVFNLSVLGIGALRRWVGRMEQQEIAKVSALGTTEHP